MRHQIEGHDITFLGKLNHVHWYASDWSDETVELCHDTDSDIIKFCRTLGDSLEVYINGNRNECPLRVTDDAVYITFERN